MLCEFECIFRVVVAVKDIKECERVPASVVAERLLSHLAHLKVLEDCGYFLTVTKVKSIGNGKLVESAKCIIFPVSFCCRTFLPKTGEVLVGVVIRVFSQGVFLKCGPMNVIYLSVQKMPNYTYVPGEKPFFLSNDDQSRIENEVAVRFRVFAVRWRNVREFAMLSSREFHILASIEGDSLGPISLNGLDGLDL